MDGQLWGTIVGGLIGFAAAAIPSIMNMILEYLNHLKALHQGQQRIDASKAGVPEAIPPVNPTPVPEVPVKSCRVNRRDRITCRYPEKVEDIDSSRVGDAEQESVPSPDTGEPPSIITKLFASLRAGVRPIITYGFFALFVFVKLKGITQGYYVDHTPALQLLPVIWDDGTHTLFTAILAYWFGSRAFEKTQTVRIEATQAKIDAVK